MHYIIDGYNMLFRLMHDAKDDLQTGRDIIIQDINKKASLLKWDITLVFDSTFQMGDRTRTHFDAIEIVFTAEGETADEYILSELKESPAPRQEMVITSDKKLAWRARHRSANTENVENFIITLNRAYKNKLRQQKKSRLRENFLGPPSSRTTDKSSQEAVPALVPPIETPLEACTDYYAQIFAVEWKKLEKEEKIKKDIKKLSSEKRKKRKPKQPVDPFAPPPLPEPNAPTEMERWLKLFENRPLA